jgi:hypothetical protein
MIKVVSEVGSPENALALLYQGVAAAVVWGLVIGGVAAWVATAVRSGSGKADE